AESLLRRAADRNPADQDVQWFLGLARLEQDDFDGAEQAFERLVDEADDAKTEYAVAGRMALAIARGVDDPERGVEPFVEAVERDPGLAVSAARTLAMAGRQRPVREIAERASSAAPDDGEVGFAYASILQGTGESDRAVAEVERLLATDAANDVDLAVGLRLVGAAADAERYRFGAARERLRGALDLQPGHPQALQLLVRAVLEGRGSRGDLDDLRRRISVAREANESPEFRALLDQLEAGLAEVANDA
ncbi:MAG: tetratricopeptide repeat protein, partial [Planctomycetota bacterium JB042]